MLIAMETSERSTSAESLDIILFYGKSEQSIWNSLYRPYDERTLIETIAAPIQTAEDIESIIFKGREEREGKSSYMR